MHSITKFLLLIFSFTTGVLLHADRPNVLFIAIDDLNDWVKPLAGHPQTITPAMDKLARESAVFVNSFCTSSECNPSRISMLTGYHPKTTGFSNNFLPIRTRTWTGNDEIGNDVAGYSNYPIPDMAEVKTMPQWFRENGYKTLGVGKIFHDHDKKNVDATLSWDVWHEVSGYDLTGNHNYSGIFDGKVLWQDWGAVAYEKEDTADYQRAEWAAKQLRSASSEEPFFLAVGFKKPHDPFYAPEEYFDKFPEEDFVRLPAISKSDLEDIGYMGKLMADKKDGIVSEYEKVAGENKFNKDYRKSMVRAYLATINYVDECVSVVLNALENSPHKNNTIVVLWSDHGLHLGEKLHYHKFTFWDQATRNLTMIKAPGVVAGEREQTVSAHDLFPTLVDLCGLPEDYLQEEFNQQGHSLRPLLDDAGKGWAVPALTTNYKRYHPMSSQLRGETYSDQFFGHGLRTQRWKMIEYIPNNSTAEREYELYNLDEDPEEWTNLAEKPEYAVIQSKLTKLIHKFPGGEDGAQKENTAPTLILTSSREGETTLLQAEALDADGPDEIDRVDFYADGILLSSDNSFPYEIETNNKADQFTAIVYDTSKAIDIFVLPHSH